MRNYHVQFLGGNRAAMPVTYPVHLVTKERRLTMRTFAQKPKATQQITPAKTTKPGRAKFGQRREVNSVLHLQHTIGNQAVLRLHQANAEEFQAGSATTASTRFGHDFSRIPIFNSSPVQVLPTLTVSTPRERDEQEADSVADQVMRMPEPQQERHKGGKEPRSSDIQAKPAGDSADGGRPEVTTELETQVKSLISRGRPLSKSLRSFFEPRFGVDFGRVRLHADTEVAGMAAAFGARAFTVDSHVVLGAGELAPDSDAGRRLLAHELTHVVQQGAAPLRTAGSLATSIRPAERNLHLQRQCRTDDPAVPLGGQPIFFKVGKTEVVDVAAIEFLVNSWRDTGAKAKIRIDGFASTDGSKSLNLTLSCRRAQAVKREMAEKKVPASFIELFGQGETNRFSTKSLEENRRAQVFMDVPFVSGFEVAAKRQEKQEFAKGIVGECKVAEVPKFVLNAQGKIHIDIGGEGHYPGANNLNPSSVGTSPPYVRPDKIIPEHVCGVGESIPASHSTVDLITVESTPMTTRTYSEIARVIRSGGEIRLLHPHSLKQYHQRTFYEVSLRHKIDGSRTKLYTTGESASGKSGMLSVIKLK